MSTTTINREQGEGDARKPRKYIVNIEGVEHSWTRATITVPELRELGGIPSDQQIVEVDLEENTERTLAEDEVVRIKPGKGFSKKVRFQRG